MTASTKTAATASAIVLTAEQHATLAGTAVVRLVASDADGNLAWPAQPAVVSVIRTAEGTLTAQLRDGGTRTQCQLSAATLDALNERVDELFARITPDCDLWSAYLALEFGQR